MPVSNNQLPGTKLTFLIVLSTFQIEMAEHFAQRVQGTLTGFRANCLAVDWMVKNSCQRCRYEGLLPTERCIPWPAYSIHDSPGRVFVQPCMHLAAAHSNNRFTLGWRFPVNWAKFCQEKQRS